MKKDTLRFLVIGLLVLITYHLGIFMVPFLKTATFWTSWGYTLLAFVVGGYQIFEGFVEKPDAKSRFYGFPIAKIALTYLVVQIILSIVFMAFGAILPLWSAVLVFTLVFTLAVTGLLAADAVVEEIHVQDVKLKKDVALMRGLQSKVQQMVAQCDNPDAAAAVRKFAEELRYSDPVSSDAIAEIEADLSATVDELQSAIVDGDSNAAKQLCRKASFVLAERNRLCKLNKHSQNPIMPAQEAEKVVAHNNSGKFVAFAAVALCVVFAFVVLLNVVLIPNTAYRKAVKLMDSGSAIEAYDALLALDGYKDSAEKAASIYDQYKIELLKTASVGDCVLFGSCEQDGDTANGSEDVQWLVLDKQDDKLLVISRFALDCQPYNETQKDIMWETCTLRQWLNNGFLNSTFSELERTHISTTVVTAEKNPLYYTKFGTDTEDQIFLLSAGEVTRYFSSRNDRVCQLAETGERCNWWLRTSGRYQRYAVVIDMTGEMDEIGAEAIREDIAIRPALWIDLQS